jgi:hypothetical protein
VKGAIFATGVLLLGSVDADAGSATQVTITRIEAQDRGHFFFYLSSPILKSPSCASQPATAFVVDGSTYAGGVIITVVLEAYSLGKLVIATGHNSCKVHAGYEDLLSVATVADAPPRQAGGLRQ